MVDLSDFTSRTFVVSFLVLVIKEACSLCVSSSIWLSVLVDVTSSLSGNDWDGGGGELGGCGGVEGAL